MNDTPMSDTPRRMALIRIGWDELRQLLGLPTTAIVTGISTQTFFREDDIAIRVEGVGSFIYPGCTLTAYRLCDLPQLMPDEPTVVEGRP